MVIPAIQLLKLCHLKEEIELEIMDPGYFLLKQAIKSPWFFPVHLRLIFIEELV